MFQVQIKDLDLTPINTWIPDTMAFGTRARFGAREFSYSNTPDRLGQLTF